MTVDVPRAVPVRANQAHAAVNTVLSVDYRHKTAVLMLIITAQIAKSYRDSRDILARISCGILLLWVFPSLVGTEFMTCLVGFWGKLIGTPLVNYFC